MPRLWLLTHRYQSRIFQQKTVPDIVQAVFTGAGLTSDQFKLTLNETYEPREYCVQYRETDFNFVCRLLEEEVPWGPLMRKVSEETSISRHAPS